MSECRVGIIAEGPTDVSVIKGIVKTIFPNKVFVFNSISPTQEEIETQQKDEGFGWGGVYRVCRRLRDKLELAEAISGSFDCVIIHIDADVAYKSYSDIGESNPLKDDLPCVKLNDTVESVCTSLESVLLNWLDNDYSKIVTCIPYICTETWVGCWVYRQQWSDIEECTDEQTIYELLYRLGMPKNEKDNRLIEKKAKGLKKRTKGYKNAATRLSPELWNLVTNRYKQADLFDKKLSTLISD